MNLSRSYQRYIDIATKLAKDVPWNHKHGCVIMKSGRILGKGKNDYSNSMHSECSALACNWLSEFKGAVLFVVRLKKLQTWGLSKPCSKCEEAIKLAGISKVVYTTDDPLNPIEMICYE